MTTTITAPTPLDIARKELHAAEEDLVIFRRVRDRNFASRLRYDQAARAVLLARKAFARCFAEAQKAEESQ